MAAVIERGARPCGCAPYSRTRCVEGLRLLDEHALALNRVRPAYQEFVTNTTPETRQALIDAHKAARLLGEQVDAHFGEEV